MPGKSVPFTKTQIEKIIQKHPTPFHLYDEKAIRETPVLSLTLLTGMRDLKNFSPLRPLPILI